MQHASLHPALLLLLLWKLGGFASSTMLQQSHARYLIASFCLPDTQRLCREHLLLHSGSKQGTFRHSGGRLGPTEQISQERGAIGGKVQLEPEGGLNPVVMITASSVRSAPGSPLVCLRRHLNHSKAGSYVQHL